MDYSNRIKSIIDKYSLEERKLRDRFNRELFELYKKRNEEIEDLKKTFENLEKNKNNNNSINQNNNIKISKSSKEQIEYFPLAPIPENRRKEEEYKPQNLVPRPLPIPRTSSSIEKVRKLNMKGNELKKNREQVLKKFNLILKNNKK